ncbi:midasin, putative [Talaromyces stipitatus ATCC 10500]|uniref:Midasin n=1 Tax=Talaromyces stipitatus (strain ATCC 10500 / CBS 375.48 / QM 6759 / NRRL 1006) TaxID=441959 RepID=B8MLH9_TALSN|nr:midasin, putative [Talaromyces stipitatus ATCC 10500]EED15512.1 midasin, putative [Talaromyces stipitatus ATCC 10500]
MEERPVFELKLSEAEGLRRLPNDLAERLRNASGSQYLDALALAALEPGNTEWIFTTYERLIVDIASRWLDLDPQNYYLNILSAFSRILPFAPYLRHFTHDYARSHSETFSGSFLNFDGATIRKALLCIFRLSSFDIESFTAVISPIQLQSLFQHADSCVRYLAVRCFCYYMRTGDAATQRMVTTHIGTGVIEGPWENTVIDYRLLGLWEERRWHLFEADLCSRRSSLTLNTAWDIVDRHRENFSHRTAYIGGVLVPKVRWDRPTPESNLVKTATVTNNLRGIATALLEQKPLLLIGLPNSGKTSLVNDVAREMGQRKERIKCADGFRIIATMKSSLNSKGEEVAQSHGLLGARLWNKVQINSLPLIEVREVLIEKYPVLSARVPTLIDIYDRLCSAFHSSLAARSAQGRTPGLRDLIKLCNRLHKRLLRLGVTTGNEATPESFQDEIFLDTVDAFIRYLPDRDFGHRLSSIVAEELQLSPQRADYCLQERTPPYADYEDKFSVGREVCTKMKVTKTAKSRFNKLTNWFAPTRAALRTMEQIAAAVQVSEPVLLVGETGIGKTAVIQQLANLTCQKLTVVNLSQQSESSDLLGGFRPVNLRSTAIPLLDEFNQLFEQTFSAKKNQKFLSSVTKSLTAGNWPRLVNLWHEAVRMSDSLFRAPKGSDQRTEEQPSKKRKLDSPKYAALRDKWESFKVQLSDFEAQASRGDSKFAFAFVQGKIVRALRNGEWVLLDEINLATPDILENIASLLHHGDEGMPSVLLSEAGDVERVYGHSDFRIFGAMNPATDAGKRDLAPGLRSRFTEIYVHSPDVDFDDLLGLIQTYLGNLSQSDLRLASDIASLYLATKKLMLENKLTDGAGQKPHFSIRTLVRSLVYITDHVHSYGLRRAAYEGFCMSFLTLLSQESEKLVVPLIEKHIFGSTKHAKSLLGQVPRAPEDGSEYVQFKHYWMKKGPFTAEKQPHYIITPFIEKNLKNLLRASSTRRFPILLQGPTSSGKTSMVEYLAKISGNKFVRINNHEHTDLQEYLGSYVSTDDGSLTYQEGVLVEALRNGHWIVLDELNLAPSDVLEALNRLLDDNRELFLPETQEVIQPHPNFMLFATQNPAGLYGGRKVLSRAFRNRFLELHFDDIPEDELEYILKERTQIAPSFCSRIVSVYKKLSVLRQSTRLFEQKNSFATLRDLFRWALRQADDRETLAINGFMLLAERVRNSSERAAVKKVIEDVMKVKIDEDAIYGLAELERRAEGRASLSKNVVWTKAMRRVFVLVSEALRNNEPVLLVGETGCGKTQICQAVAEIYGKEMFIVNAHVNLETGDIVGAQRPLRNRSAIERQLRDDLASVLSTLSKADVDQSSRSLEDLKISFAQLAPETLEAIPAELLDCIKTNITRSQALFEWSDGSLITAMKTGQYFLLDEVSLADDSVLERLNSVLEPHRSLLLAEKGPVDSLVIAQDGYQFLSTMNPGGDYGKRELSAALRNRMTEIWVPQLSEEEDILPILKDKLQSMDENKTKAMLQFAKWFKQTFQGSSTFSVSIRDLLGWVEFINKCPPSNPEFAIVQGAAMVYIDTLGANPSAMLSTSTDSVAQSRQLCLEKLGSLLEIDAVRIYNENATVSTQDGYLCVGPFRLPVSPGSSPDPDFVMDAPTTIANSVRIARGLQTSKPILLEGSPGVGKTTLVASLARALGKPLTRINLSDQTDLTDLFGSDVPVEGGDVGQFAWRDAPFLQAMQRGDWVLLDEMNLASQSVLEGLNSCLDHRQQVYVAELDQTFKRHPDFALFAAQNPHHQGGGRKGLPASFVNRFTVVYADSFSDTDLNSICSKLFPRIPADQTSKMVEFMSKLNWAIDYDREFANIGGPWELNLRDILRWFQLADRGNVQLPSGYFLENIISHRFRTEKDRSLISALFEESFKIPAPEKSYYHNLTVEKFQVGLAIMPRRQLEQSTTHSDVKILPAHLPILESLMFCIERAWPSILVGPSGCGKTTTIRTLASIQGAELVELALSADTDTMDLIGGFEQIDYRRQTQSLAKDVVNFVHHQIITTVTSESASSSIVHLLEAYGVCSNPEINIETLADVINALQPHFDSLAFASLIQRCKALVQTSKDANKVGFEWTEGALTEAIQLGHWVVLDNANLCNASVLDRLNSLMEPNGYLVLNEQRTEDGSARTIRPHPNFRLFLTMDPRNGELSRAMRNRSVEVCFLSEFPAVASSVYTPLFTLESALYRLRYVWNCDPESQSSDVADQLFGIRLDHVEMSDLANFNHSLRQLAISFPDAEQSKAAMEILERYAKLVEGNFQWKALFSLSMEIGDQGAELVHPLVNEPRLTWHSSQADRIILLSQLQGVKLSLHQLQQRLVHSHQNSQHLKPSQMTRLERSFASSRISSLMKDDTQAVSSFLTDFVHTSYEFIQRLDNDSGLVNDALSVLKDFTKICWDIYTVTQVKELDEGVFQIYLQIGQQILSSAAESQSALSPLFSALAQLLSRFRSTWALKTGLSMRRIWDAWRPVTCTDVEQLNSLLDLEGVVSGFNKIALQTRLNISQLGLVRKSLIEAQNAMLLNNADGKLLVPSLKQQVTELVSATEIYSSPQPPHFLKVFESICEYHDLPILYNESQIQHHGHLNETLPLLAGRPAYSTVPFNEKFPVSSILHRLALYNGSEGAMLAVSPWSSAFSVDLLQHVQRTNEVLLGRLDFFQSELHALVEAVSYSSREISLSQTVLLARVFTRVILEILCLHQDFLNTTSLEVVVSALCDLEKTGTFHGSIPQLEPAMDLPPNHFFREFVNDLSGCIQTLANVRNNSSVSTLYELGHVCVQLSVFCLRLFVPDKPYDPSLGLVVERQRHADQVLQLTAEDEALATFEKEFSGRTSNLRRCLIKEELKRLGSTPSASPVSRPAKSRLMELHGEFMNLHNSVLSRTPETFGVAEFQQYGNLLKDNVRLICARLRSNFRVYDDITVLVTRFLTMLDLGASLCLGGANKSQSKISQIITQTTPFIGGNTYPLMKKPVHAVASMKNQIKVQIHQLSSLALHHGANSANLDSEAALSHLKEIFQSLHLIWKKQLVEDQKEAAEKSQTYRYKGSFEDSEEVDESELRELFPVYEGTEEEVSEKPRMDINSISLRLTELHAAIFAPGDIEGNLREFIVESTRLLGSLDSGQDSYAPPESYLPGILLVLKDELKSYENVSPRRYNFYLDANIAEAKRLVSLVLSVRNRFVQLQAAWPEHAAIHDVLVCCQEILQFKHLEPVAKYITKLEKLHGLVHEWQLVASKDYSAASLYDQITALTISWRRLELSTWAKLLDLEFEKCEKAVSTWWFVAYEAFIALPLQKAENGEDLKDYTTEALHTLEAFLKSTTIGQFSARLRLIEQFRSLLQLFANHNPTLSCIVSALENFLHHYRPYEPVVNKTLEEKRKSLDKDVKEQIQLASWKDTNITALRESARRSHYKLFKYVRKYREFLSQPTDQILQQGMPDLHEQSLDINFAKPLPVSLWDSSDALMVCERYDPIWANRAPRFKDPSTTAVNMLRVYTSSLSELDVPSQLSSFVTDVIETVKSFKSETPSTLTEDNKQHVQHLKTQKRRFYAETLRQLHFMGIRRNVSTVFIEEQATINQVLATTPNIIVEHGPAATVAQSADSYLHRFLDVLPHVRKYSREYNEDLNPTEVTRSIGSAEGFLVLIRKQREDLAPVIKHLVGLKSTSADMKVLWTHGPSRLRQDNRSGLTERENSFRRVSWLIPLLGVGKEIVEIHSLYSGSPSVAGTFQLWKDTFARLRNGIERLPHLPEGLTSQVTIDTELEVRSCFAQLKSEFTTLIEDRPELAFVLEQAISWLEIPAPSDATSAESDMVIDNLNDHYLSAVNKILVALQELKGSLASLPPDMENKDWLSRTDSSLSKALRDLHIGDIARSLNSVLDKLQSLQDSDSSLPLASAIIAGLLPITEQYYNICEDMIGRYLGVHREICKMAYILSKSFTQIASEGFCSPHEASTEESGSGKVESGTGLGEGEGAEDISKDIQDDEDLSELAQEKDQEKSSKDDIDKSEDAVNMDQEDLEGEFDDEQKETEGEDKEDMSGEEGDDEIDEEVGSVNDLDPNAVDEKLWEGAHDEKQKETENEEGKGQSEKDEQAAANDKKEQDLKDQEEKGDEPMEAEEGEREEAPEDEEETGGREELDVTDPHAKEEQTLDLPEEMQLDGEGPEDAESDMSDDGMDELSDFEPATNGDKAEETVDEDERSATPDPGDIDMEDNHQNEAESGEPEGEQEANIAGEEETLDEELEAEQKENKALEKDENTAAGENADQSDEIAGGIGLDTDTKEEKGSSGNAQQEGGAEEASSEEQPNGATEEGADQKKAESSSGGAGEDSQDDPQSEAFKKLGNVLEEWHRRQREIMNSSRDKEKQTLPLDTNMADAEFEHLADEDDVADTQALGQASEEQAEALDQQKGVEAEKPSVTDDIPPDVMDGDKDNQPDENLLDEAAMDLDVAEVNATEGAQTAKGTLVGETYKERDGEPPMTEELDEVDTHLAAIHLSSANATKTSIDEARRLWAHYEAVTNDLSLSLTEQLRLILAPTLATKLRGDFRTGKRLNIKKIIPYIASQYKRDKIWMRRSIPSKRNYQIMLAVDDSKSMLESGSGQLAFETLALVARSLSMLEAGDLCIVAFGDEEHVRVAHEFGKPFSSEAGTQVFQQFSYQQTGTNVRKLVADSIALFREARGRKSGGGGNSADLWQLELIISDGICEDHETIRRLVRQAQEERIMIVFIIVDAASGSSILDLTQASFEPDDSAMGTGEMKLKMKRYLEGFPFAYYLVVRDVRELPAVLAMALKQWFAEVVETSS